MTTSLRLGPCSVTAGGRALLITVHTADLVDAGRRLDAVRNGLRDTAHEFDDNGWRYSFYFECVEAEFVAEQIRGVWWDRVVLMTRPDYVARYVTSMSGPFSFAVRQTGNFLWLLSCRHTRRSS